MPAIDEMWMMAPPSISAIHGITFQLARTAASRSTFSDDSQAAASSENEMPLGLLTENVRPSEHSARRIKETIQRLAVRHVTYRRMGEDGSRAQFGLHLAQRRLAARANGDSHSFICQTKRDRSTDAPARAGHDRGLSFQAQISWYLPAVARLNRARPSPRSP